MTDDFGNAGSRTHEFGARAKRAVNRAREQVAMLVDASPEDVLFTSGATESNNIALLGLGTFGRTQGKRHILSSGIEHKAVIEPLEHLAKQGFEIELAPVDASGRVNPADVVERVRADTLLVSLMHVNNETGVVQPIREIAEQLSPEPYFHVDAAQGFGKLHDDLKHQRIDLISVSGHKIFAPKGVGALITRRRGYDAPPLAPLMFGGGQERGLRPGTSPVALVAGLGLASEICAQEAENRLAVCRTRREELLSALEILSPSFHGQQTATVPHIVNFSLPGWDSEALLLMWKDTLAFSNGSACTSASYTPSHVLTAMGLPDLDVMGAVRLSWSHLTPSVDWSELVERVRNTSW